HRDIKPANIMLTPQGEPKIMDFGIAKASAAQLTMAGQVFGTPAYMSPEQATGEEVDGRSDIFSLGAVLHELLTNTRAFEGPTMPVTLTRILREEPLPPSTFGYGIPRALDAIVARALRKSRDARYDSAAHFAADLENLIEGKTPVHATQLTPIETVDLKAIQRPTGPGGLVSPAPLAHRLEAKGRRVQLDLSPVDRPPQASMRLIAAIALGIVFGVAVVLIAQRRSTSEPERSNANGITSPAAAAGTGSVVPITQPTLLPSSQASAPPQASQSLVPLSVDSAGQPVGVEVELRHPFASASLRIKVDNRIVLATSTNGMPVKSGGTVTAYDGRYGTELRITPGEHEIRLELRSGINEFNEATRVRVNPAQPPKIGAVVEGNRLTLVVKE
ncbi:MAG: serine/threonine-protein kinase, partial [Vicinamibacteria bacterium]